MSIEIPTVVHIRWNRLQPQLAPRNSLLMILTKISTGLSQSSNSSQTGLLIIMNLLVFDIIMRSQPRAIQL
ncbi:hypothetical protein HanIR_Chr02g0057381 [Helianthus annuus]|nr:hypothetical protein HanIR_Chr02g0057381 [Helianthus annuus]